MSATKPNNTDKPDDGWGLLFIAEIVQKNPKFAQNQFNALFNQFDQLFISDTEYHTTFQGQINKQSLEKNATEIKEYIKSSKIEVKEIVETVKKKGINNEHIKKLFNIFSKHREIIKLLLEPEFIQNMEGEIRKIIHETSYTDALEIKAQAKTIEDQAKVLKQTLITSLFDRIGQTETTSAAKIEALEKQVTDLKKQLETQTTEKTELQKEINELKKQIESDLLLKDDTTKLKLQNKITKLESALENAKIEIAKSMQLLQENKTLKQENKTLKQENKTLTQENKTLKQENKTLKQENKTLKQENQKLHAKVQTLTQENQEKSNQVLGKNDEYIQIDEDTQTNVNQLFSIKKLEHYQGLGVDNEKLRQELENKESENETLKQNNNDLIANNNDLIASNNNLIASNNGLIASSNNFAKLAMEENQRLNNENKTLKNKNETLKIQNKLLKGKNEQNLPQPTSILSTENNILSTENKMPVTKSYSKAIKDDNTNLTSPITQTTENKTQPEDLKFKNALGTILKNMIQQLRNNDTRDDTYRMQFLQEFKQFISYQSNGLVQNKDHSNGRNQVLNIIVHNLLSVPLFPQISSKEIFEYMMTGLIRLQYKNNDFIDQKDYQNQSVNNESVKVKVNVNVNQSFLNNCIEYLKSFNQEKNTALKESTGGMLYFGSNFPKWHDEINRLKQGLNELEPIPNNQIKNQTLNILEETAKFDKNNPIPKTVLSIKAIEIMSCLLDLLEKFLSAQQTQIAPAKNRSIPPTQPVLPNTNNLQGQQNKINDSDVLKIKNKEQLTQAPEPPIKQTKSKQQKVLQTNLTSTLTSISEGAKSNQTLQKNTQGQLFSDMLKINKK